MGLDNIFLIVIRFIMAIVTGLMALFLLFSEKVMGMVKKATKQADNATTVVRTPAGVRAPVPAQVQPSPPPATDRQPLVTEVPASVRMAQTAAPAPAEPEPEPAGEPDELDWAGSLNHAAAAAALLGEVLDALESGGLAIQPEHAATITPLAERLAAFQERTDGALGPLLGQMSEIELQDFMADFAAYTNPDP